MSRTLVQRRLLYAVFLVATAAVALIGLVLFNQRAAASASQATTVGLELVEPAKTGEAITVRLVAQNARNLAGFQSRLHFDTSKLRLVDASAATDLEASGRDLLALEPVVHNGTVALAAATCPVADCQATRPKRVQRINRGVDGQIVLGTFVFYTDQPSQSTLTLDGVKLVDPQGNLQAVTATNIVLDVTQP